MKTYIANKRIASRDGSTVWLAGDKIELDDDKAAIFLEKGIVIEKEQEQAVVVDMTEPEDSEDES